MYVTYELSLIENPVFYQWLFQKNIKESNSLDVTKPEAKYDAKRYSQLLDECCRSVIEPFLNEYQT